MKDDDLRASLVKDFPELADSEMSDSKEVYAHFGLLMFQYSLLEHSLINLLMLHRSIGDVKIGKAVDQPSWANSMDEHYEFSRSLTFGNLIRHVVAVPRYKTFEPELLAVKKQRDYFAHHFFRDEIALFGSSEGRWFLLERMTLARQRVEGAEENIKPEFNKRAKRIGLPIATEQIVDETIAAEFLAVQRRVSLKEAVVGWELGEDEDAK